MSNDATIPDASHVEADAAPDQMVVTPEMLRADDPPTTWLGRWYRSIETWLTKKSNESNRWHRFLAWVFLPLAYRSGIKLGTQTDDGGYEAVMPFSRFNKNWYNAMAGAALLANSEVAGGMYIFNKVGPEYSVVCKELHYKFRLPCLGPAIYRVKPVDDIDELKRHNVEFNATVEMHVVQAVHHKDHKERKVGKATITYHVAPMAKLRARQAKANAPIPARLALGLLIPIVIGLAGLVTGLIKMDWWMVPGFAVLFLAHAFLANGRLRHNKLWMRWAALGLVVATAGAGLVALFWQAYMFESLYGAIAAGGTVALLLVCAVALVWPKRVAEAG